MVRSVHVYTYGDHVYAPLASVTGCMITCGLRYLHVTQFKEVWQVFTSVFCLCVNK